MPCFSCCEDAMLRQLRAIRFFPTFRGSHDRRNPAPPGADFTLHVNPFVKIFMEFNPSYRETIESLLRKGFRAAAIEDDATLTFLDIENVLKRPMWSMLFFTR